MILLNDKCAALKKPPSSRQQNLAFFRLDVKQIAFSKYTSDCLLNGVIGTVHNKISIIAWAYDAKRLRSPAEFHDLCANEVFGIFIAWLKTVTEFDPSYLTIVWLKVANLTFQSQFFPSFNFHFSWEMWWIAKFSLAPSLLSHMFRAFSLNYS